MCEVNGGVAGWKVNGTTYNDLPSDIRSNLNASKVAGAGGNVLLTLTIPGKAIYDGTIVACVHARNYSSPPQESRNVTMKVQGDVCSTTT